jgi:hypothetical protein
VFQLEHRVFSLELRVVRLAASNFQMNQRVFQRSSLLVRLNEAVILEKPSMFATTASRFSMTLRVSFDDEERFVEEQCVVVVNEALFSMDP